MRIISLVPSLTELLIDLGLENQIVGRTKFCIHPKDKIKSIPKIGGTKNVNLEAVIQLHPDLIIANKEENTREDIIALRDVCSVHVTDISNFTESLNAIQTLGTLTHRSNEATQLIGKINSNFSQLSSISNSKKTVCYLIWKDPMMTVGQDTFIHDMLDKCGLLNVFGNQSRYPTIDTQNILDENPNYIFLSSEPFPFKEKHIHEFKKTYPNSKIVLVDGEYFSWYGSRMVSAPIYFLSLLQSI